MLLSLFALLPARACSLLVVTLLITSLGRARAQAPPYAWAVGVGTTTLGQIGTADRHDCDVTKIAVAVSGQTYVTGNFERSVDFGPMTLTSAGGKDVFLAKLDASGNALWAVRAGDRGEDVGFGVAVDAAENVYVTGYFRYAATFGAFTLTGPGLSVGFVAKYSPLGVCQWAIPMTQQGGYGGALAVDTNGEVAISGTFTAPTAQFGATTLQMVGSNENGFIAKLSAQGNWRWAARTGSRGGNVALDPAGNVYCAGNFAGTNAFGPILLTSNGGQDGFVAKLDPAGNWLWVKSAGGPGYDFGGGVGVDYAGNVLVAGGFYQPSASFDAITIPNLGASNFDAYVAKLDPNGNYLWAVGAGGTDSDLADDVVVDDDGSAYITGEFQDYGIGGTFGTIVLPNLGRRYSQYYVAKLSPGGTFEWVATTSSGSNGESGQAVALDHRGGVYAAGFYTGPRMVVGSTALVGNPGAHTGFLAKIGDSPLAKVVALTPPQGGAGTRVAVRGARLAGATAVYFNGVPAASFVVTSPTTLTAIAPPGVSTGPVSVQTPAGPGPAGLVFQAGTPTAVASLLRPARGCWPNPVAAGQPVHLGKAVGLQGNSAQATLYNLLGQLVVTGPVPASGEVALGTVPCGSYVLVVRTAGQPVLRYPLQVQ